MFDSNIFYGIALPKSFKVIQPSVSGIDPEELV